VKINEVWGRKSKSASSKNQASWVDIANELPASARAKKGNTFQQQFEIVDDNPITIQWKNQIFQRKDGTGPWVNFPAGKPVSDQMIAALDKVSPPPELEKPQVKQKPISITDHAGVQWNYNDSDRQWYGPDNSPVTDPTSIKKLNNAATIQFQNRQMGG
jgi:hypothetical protein